MTTPRFVELAEGLAAHDQQVADYLTQQAEERAKLVEELNAATTESAIVAGMPPVGSNGHAPSPGKRGRKPGSTNKPKAATGTTKKATRPDAQDGPALVLGIIRKHRNGITSADVTTEMCKHWADGTWDTDAKEGTIASNVSQILNGLRKKELVTMERDDELKKNLYSVA